MRGRQKYLLRGWECFMSSVWWDEGLELLCWAPLEWDGANPPVPSHQSLSEHNLLLLLFLCIFSACFLYSKHKQQGRLLGPSMDGTRPPITWIKSLPTPGWFGIIPPAPLTEKGQANLLPWAWRTAQKYHQRPTNLPEQINGNDRKANKQTNTLPNRFILIFFCLENKCG